MLEDKELGFYSRQADQQTEENKQSEDLVEVPHKSTLFMLMMSKDDNLLLQMGGLISSLIDAQFLTDELKSQVPELFTLMASQSESSANV